MKNTRLLLLLTALLIMLYACKKESFSDQANPSNSITNNNLSENSESHIFNFGGNTANQRSGISADIDHTILGDLRVNPYTVEKMTIAYNTINAVPVAEVATTNLYVKFCPTTIEEAAELFDTDLNLYDFPLEYEVIEMGDSYVDPSLGPDDIPCFYAIVEPGYVLPPYAELVDLLHLSDYNTRLTEKAFEQTGNTYEKTMCFEDDENWPECQCDDFLNNPVAWQTCIDNIYYPPPPEPPTNCLNSNTRRPSGFIKVQDTQTLQMEGVRQVKVILKDDWFTEDEVWTNHEGCFKLNENYSKKNMWMWVKWKNSRCKIRGAANSEWYRIDQILGAMKDYIGKIKKPPYNNIEVNYYWNPADAVAKNGHKVHMRWAACTVNNGVHEFHDYAAEDGIAAPPNGLNMYLGRNSTEAYALMTRKVGPSSAALAITEGIAEGNQVIDDLFIFIPSFKLLTYSTTTIILHFFPDIHIGLENTAGNLRMTNSDELKNVTYHEVAHASHYAQVGTGFWLAEIKATVAAGGWGGPDVFDAGRIAICESWAQHIGDTYTDRRFGLSHSNGGANPLQIARRRWINLLEGDFLEGGDQGDHVPVALYHDLIDNNSVPIFGSIENTAITSDGGPGGGGVTGYTNAIIFSHLTSNTTTPIILRENLKTTLPSGITGPAVDALFLDYGY